MSWNWRNVFRLQGTSTDQVHVTLTPEPDLDRPEPGREQEARWGGTDITHKNTDLIRSRAQELAAGIDPREATSWPEMSGQEADPAFNQFVGQLGAYYEAQLEGVPEIDPTQWPRWDGQSEEIGDWADGGGDWADPQYAAWRDADDVDILTPAYDLENEPGIEEPPEPS